MKSFESSNNDVVVVGSLPDDDQTICIFDYYVDEAGDWDPWQSKVPEVSFGNSWDLLGQVYIDTIDTVSLRLNPHVSHLIVSNLEIYIAPVL